MYLFVTIPVQSTCFSHVFKSVEREGQSEVASFVLEEEEEVFERRVGWSENRIVTQNPSRPFSFSSSYS